MSAIDSALIPNYPKTTQQMNEIIPILENNFLTKNLSSAEINKLASAMKIEHYVRKKRIITYGDQGTHYFILSKGTV